MRQLLETDGWYSSALLLLVFCTLAPLSGCALPKRGMLADNVYYSTTSPDIEVRVNGDYSYRDGGRGEFRHQFIDEENHRMIFVHHVLHDTNETQVDYYIPPEHWIYASSPQITEIERFTQKNLGQTWYLQDYIEHVSTIACFMVRKQSAFTSMHDLFHILYYWQIPPYQCQGWKETDTLSEAQQGYLEDFRDGFTRDLSLNNYTKQREPDDG